ncbi:putative MFS family arabinose efflux permease [Sedimentibacter acidaminivorans]|uniref:MFS family arabinose efflux permease n=1 Tax=Sedimentibacter acidaminivorans TaxID=913099 RepID=A0ABS4GCT1_9FIRM|nr:MFS transporter [Sedimentibacter acidaminivorans]MBP1925508.1 putative MFS family arabinose efflux permease [Sedimentibacter acidaminivorans]
MRKILKMKTEMLMFFILIAVVSLGNGFSDSLYSNYFKEVYHITAVQRGFIEFPRELPGMLCMVVVSLLGFLGNIRVALIAQILSFVGLTILGFFTPSFSVMLVFLFINSMGMHLFMPLRDSIGMSLADPNKVGLRMGQIFSVGSAFSMIAALIVFFGFKTGFFTFNTSIKVVFLFGSGCFLCAIIMASMMLKRVKPLKERRGKVKFIFRKQYRYYYTVTILKGVQKQIAFVYGTWVIVELLGKKADTLALLYIIVGFISMFFLNKLGKMMDKFGIKNMMYADAISFVVVYVIYGFFVWGITSGKLPKEGFTVWMIYLLFVLDRLSMQIGMVNSIYVRSITLDKNEVTSILSTGISLDHVFSIIAGVAGGFVWAKLGSQWVFFIAAALSLGNVYVAYRVQPEKEKEEVEKRLHELAC